MSCLDDETLVALAEGTLLGATKAAALGHVEACVTCAALVGQAARLSGLDRPNLGRYRMAEPIGAGGMGRVYLAYDPALDREVAVKIVHVDALDPAVGEGRLRREAQMLAALDHPSICKVFDVQEAEGTMFIAMELVRGRTLAAWLATRPPTSAIVDAFVQAGEGLAAAHDAGVVHRDFKPANVMVSDDRRQRVVVLDFGIARRERSIEASEEEPKADTASEREAGTTSAFAGTPLYMAPEQYAGIATAASDQYAFCLAMVEGLTRRFPFVEVGAIGLWRAKRERAFADGVVDAVPSRLRAALLRGLEPEPEARWPSMHALLAELRAKPRYWPLFVVGAAALGIAAAWILARPPAVEAVDAVEASTVDEPSVPACAEVVQAELARAEKELDAGRHREALPMFEKVVAGARACEQDPLLASALAGFAGALRKLDDPRVIEVAEEAHVLARLVRDDASAARAAVEIVLVARRQGKLQEAARWIEEAEIDAEKANVPELHARVLAARAALAYARDDFEDALALHREAAQIHARIDPRGDTYAVGLRDVANTLLRLERFDEAIATLEEARSILVEKLGTDHARVGEVDSELGMIYTVVDRTEDGLPYLERAVTIAERHEGAHTRSAFAAVTRLAAAYREADRLPDSVAQSRKAIALLEHIEHSPRDAAVVWMNLGKTLVQQRDMSGALEAFEKSRGILEAAEEEAPLQDLLGMNLLDSADVLEALGREREAQRLRERARALSAAK